MITSEQPKQTAHSKIPTIIAAIICSAFALWSVLWFWSAVLTVRPEAVITQWEENKENVDEKLANNMITRLKRSIAINPLDANSHLLMARYYEFLTHSHPSTRPNNNITNQYTQLAALEYKRAVQHQASWDYAWAKQANFYSNQPELNINAFKHSLSKAMLFGPYERKTQEVIIPLIFKHWPLLVNNKQQQYQAAKVIKHALKHYTHALLTLNSAKKYNQLPTLAPMLTQKWHKNRLKKYLREAAND